MARTVSFRRTIAEELQDPAFAREYTAELQRLQIAEQIARARQAAGLTQAGLAQRMGTSQPAVARLEGGEYGGYTVVTLARAAHALGHRLKVELVPARREAAMAGAKKVEPRRAGRKKR